MLGQYLSKGTDLSVYGEEELDAIADSMNNRPRATDNFNKPLAVFFRILAIAQQPATKIH